MYADSTPRRCFATFEFDISRSVLYENGRHVALPRKAAIVLSELLRQAGKLVPTARLLDALGPNIGSENVTQYVSILRKALRSGRGDSSFIATEYGNGYRFVAPVERAPAARKRTNLALLQASYHLERRDAPSLRIAHQYYTEICARDPSNDVALAGAAEANATIASHLLAPPDEAFARALLLAQAALNQNPYCARAHSVLAHIAFFHEHDPDLAIERCTTALSLDANDVLATRVLSRVAMSRKDWVGARRHLGRELELRPASLDALTMLGVVEQYERRPDSAARFLASVLELDPSFAPAQYHLGTALIEAGCAVEAISCLRGLIRRDPTPHTVAGLGRAYAAAGRIDAARRSLQWLRERPRRDHVSPYLFASMHAALGERAEAREKMSEARATGDPWAVFFEAEPRFDAVNL
jgi:DNA-binding winged helix-turn-helix (wHTH) protein/Tfp pilus assembly protein PilF